MINDPPTPWSERNGVVAWLRKHSIFLVLITTFIAFLLLTLTSFSLPLTKSLYFLHASQAGGVRFGIWGWCLETDPICIDPLHLGYTWEPQIGNTITKALVLYPLAAILSLLALVALIPICRHRTIRTDRVFAVFAILAFVISLLAFMFMIGIWGAAKSRFEKAGFKAGYGPLPWMSLFATLLLAPVTANSIWGTMAGPQPEHRETEAQIKRRRRKRWSYY